MKHHSYGRAHRGWIKGQWFRMPTQIFELFAPLPATAFKVYAALAKYANVDGICYPSQARLATDAGCHSRQVGRVLKTLCERGLIRCLERGTGRRASRYQLIGLPPVVAPGNAAELPTVTRHERDPRGDPGVTQFRITEPDQSEQPVAAAELLKELKAFGMTDECASELIGRHGVSEVEVMLENAKELAGRQKLGNPVGYVIEACRRAYDPLPGVLNKIERKKKKRQYRAKIERQNSEFLRSLSDRQVWAALQELPRYRFSADEQRLMVKINPESSVQTVREDPRFEFLRTALRTQAPEPTKNCQP